MSKDDLKKERLQILKMLTDGIINSEEAESLLNALGNSESVTPVVVESKKPSFKNLKVVIDDLEDGEKVRVQIPLEFAKVLKKGSKIGNVNLDDYDIDLAQIIDMIENGATGDIVNIESDDAKIRIFVE